MGQSGIPDDSGFYGIATLFVLSSLCVTIVTGDLIHWVPVILGLIVGAMAVKVICK